MNRSHISAQDSAQDSVQDSARDSKAPTRTALTNAAKQASQRAKDFAAVFDTLSLGSAFNNARDHASIAWMEAMQCRRKPIAMAGRRRHGTNLESR